MRHKGTRSTALAPDVLDEAMRALTIERDAMCRSGNIDPPEVLADDRVRAVRPSYRTGVLRTNPRLYYRGHESMRYYLAYGIASLRIGQPRARIYALISIVVASWAVMLVPDGTVLAYSAMLAAGVTVAALLAVVIRREVRLNREIDRITAYVSRWESPS